MVTLYGLGCIYARWLAAGWLLAAIQAAAALAGWLQGPQQLRGYAQLRVKG